MFLQECHITAWIALISTIFIGRTKGLSTNELECLFKDISLRLSIGAEIMASVRQDLPRDLKEFCRMNPCEEKPFNCNDLKKCPFRKKPLNCSGCRECPCEKKPVNCGESQSSKPIDCSDIYNNGFHKDGAYEIWPNSRISKGALKVYCDMKDGGGWTVIQRRGDFSSSEYFFYQDWMAYKTGFGNILKEFWIGNDNLFALTNQRSYQVKFDLRDRERNLAYATYREFWIDDESHDYTLHVKGYNGTAGDSFSSHNGYKFTTKDKDNDSFLSGNCAIRYKGAWWYNNCLSSNLNGLRLKGGQSTATEVIWSSFNDDQNSHKETVMKIRPADFST